MGRNLNEKRIQLDKEGRKKYVENFKQIQFKPLDGWTMPKVRGVKIDGSRD